MGNKYYLKYLVASFLLLGFQPRICAQISAEANRQLPSNFPSRLASPWENAVLTHTLESTGEVNLIEFSPNGKILATVEASQINLWDTDRGKIQLTLSPHQAQKNALEIAPVAIAFSPDSRWLATATWSQGLLTPNHGAIVWDTATGEAVLSLEKAQGCRQVSFDATGKIIYAACELGITAWSFPQGKELFSFNLENSVEKIALSLDGRIMATVDANNTPEAAKNEIKLWQLDGEKAILLNTLNGHLNHIARLEFTPDRQLLVSSSYDGKIKVWNWQKGEIYRKNNSLYSDRGLFSLSADSRLIAGNFYSSAITDIITGLPLRNVLVAPNPEEITTISFSLNGQLFARVKKSPALNSSLIYIWKWSN